MPAPIFRMFAPRSAPIAPAVLSLAAVLALASCDEMIQVAQPDMDSVEEIQKVRDERGDY